MTEIVAVQPSGSSYRAHLDEERAFLKSFGYSFFYSPDWLGAAAETLYDPDEVIHLYSRDAQGRLNGAAHFVVVETHLLKLLRPRVLTVPGCRSVVSPEHIDLAVSEEAEDTWLSYLHDHFLAREGRFDFVMLEAVDDTARFLPKLFRYLREREFAILHQKMDTCPYFDLPESFDDLLSAYSANRKKIIRRTMRRAEERVRLADYTEFGSLSDAFRIARELHSMSRKEKGQAGSFDRPGYLDFHLNLADRLQPRGKLLFKFLVADEKPAAFRYGFIDHDTYYDYQTGYNPHFSRLRPGSLIVVLLLQELIAARLRRFDFLRGDEEYKTHWTKLARDSYRYYIFPPEAKKSRFCLALQAYLKLR